jgi:hypothetical protein
LSANLLLVAESDDIVERKVTRGLPRDAVMVQPEPETSSTLECGDDSNDGDWISEEEEAMDWDV